MAKMAPMVSNTRPYPMRNARGFSSDTAEGRRLVHLTSGFVYVDAYETEHCVGDVIDHDELEDIRGRLTVLGLDEQAKRLDAVEQVARDLLYTARDRDSAFDKQYEINLALGSANTFWRFVAALNLAGWLGLMFLSF